MGILSAIQTGGMNSNLLSEQQRIAFLSKVSLFEDIKENYAALKMLSNMMTEKNFSQNQTVVKEGESGRDIFFLVQGQVSVYKKTLDGELFKVHIFKESSYSFFGEAALIEDDVRSATISADFTSICLTLNRDKFVEFCNKQPQWALPVSLRVARTVMSRLRKTNNDLMTLYDALVREVRGE